MPDRSVGAHASAPPIRADIDEDFVLTRGNHEQVMARESHDQNRSVDIQDEPAVGCGFSINDIVDFDVLGLELLHQHFVGSN